MVNAIDSNADANLKGHPLYSLHPGGGVRRLARTALADRPIDQALHAHAGAGRSDFAVLRYLAGLCGRNRPVLRRMPGGTTQLSGP